MKPELIGHWIRGPPVSRESLCRCRAVSIVIRDGAASAYLRKAEVHAVQRWRNSVGLPRVVQPDLRHRVEPIFLERGGYDMLTSAERCRKNGWGPGTYLRGTERGYGWENIGTIEITAVGIDSILARGIYKDGTIGHECVWNLDCRDWIEIRERPRYAD
jgi:hypothetical protein